jgi:hypothetical protein
MRRLAVTRFGFALIGVLALTALPAAQKKAPAAQANPWTPPRTPWGDPDLQGNFTTRDEMNTPMERPDQWAGKRPEDITVQELAEANQKRQRAALASAPFPGGGSVSKGVAIAVPIHWLDHLDSVSSRPWFVVDPPDGKIPPLTDAAKSRMAAQAVARQARGTADSYTDRTLSDRCVGFGPPFFNQALYGASYQILQTKDYVAIRSEMLHEARMIPIQARAGSRPHPNASVRTLHGDGVAHWEGNTLVVETSNFSGRGGAGWIPYRLADSNLKLTERFTRVAPNKVNVVTTVEDPTTWARGWTWAIPLTEDDTQAIFEYACHEGNLGLRNILSAGRSDDAKGIKSSDSVDAQGDLQQIE